MKSFALWEMDMSKVPADPQANGALMMKMNEGIKQWLKDNPGSEWGEFIGENKGYCISNMGPQDVMKACLMYNPYVVFKVYQAADIFEHEAAFKAVAATMH